MSKFPSLTTKHQRTLKTIFRHPSAHNLEWSHVAALIGEMGRIHEKENGEFEFEVLGKHHVMRRPHSKDLTSAEVAEIRHFLVSADLPGPGNTLDASLAPATGAPNLLIVVDHHGAKIFHIDVTSGDAKEHIIKPYDPHHFLHHLIHKDQLREQGQRAPDEIAFYEAIAMAVANASSIIIAGHGTGKSNAAHHLTDYLKTHHPETYKRVAREIVTDLSAMTPPQLLDLARQA